MFKNHRMNLLLVLMAVSMAASAGEISDRVVSGFKDGLANGGCGGYQDAAEMLASDEAVARTRGRSCLAALKQVQSGKTEAAKMNRVKSVEVQEVKSASGNKVKVVTVLTYEDGTKAKCNYNWLAMVAPTNDGAILSDKGHRCNLIK